MKHNHPHIAQAKLQLSTQTPTQLAQFQAQTGLADFYWQTLYDPSDSHMQTLDEALDHAEGYVFFLHGWDASHRIWEDLPLRLMVQRKKLACFLPDVNGFGQSPFLLDTPDPHLCCPIGMMSALEQWLEVAGLWPSRREKPPFYLFVGHSMGGAALFYKNETGWQDIAYNIYTLAPALLCNDRQNQNFYKALGLGIRIPSFTAIKNLLAPRIIEVLGGGASVVVKDEHVRVFGQTPFGTLAQTIYAMGALAQKPERSDWSRFQIALGHKDRLVHLDAMLELLDELNIRSEQIRLALGDHYFFSYDPQSPQSHKYNREVILNDLLACCDKLAQEAGYK